ncbi:hypothetical protein DF156_01930 [Burkholderia ubonensis]|nr:hypothetical protein CJO66_30440 [Burkholderia ubonensis]RQP43106.1 hypothetical protein DF155_00950 [Burkholderia ubonensis]RQP44007.1 hypothetical protein DF154_07315 [Burkholderia ubonensis]RQP47007.1 hypothetical protein DF156_01930 [Burkholderia ubonensis]RQP60334.1 hypothetical protein DF144_03980 [Burkholderia ubonensis]
MHRLTQRQAVGMPRINQPATPWPEMPFGRVRAPDAPPHYIRLTILEAAVPAQAAGFMRDSS